MISECREALAKLPKRKKWNLQKFAEMRGSKPRPSLTARTHVGHSENAIANFTVRSVVST